MLTQLKELAGEDEEEELFVKASENDRSSVLNGLKENLQSLAKTLKLDNQDSQSTRFMSRRSMIVGQQGRFSKSKGRNTLQKKHAVANIN